MALVGLCLRNVVFNAGHFLAKRGTWATRFLNDAFRIFPWPATRSNTGMVEIGGMVGFCFFLGGEAGVVGESHTSHICFLIKQLES